MSSVTDAGVRRTPQELSEARSAAARKRARWLLALHEGQAGLHELFTAATRPGGEPLASMRVRAALENQPGWTRTRASAVIHELREQTGVPQQVPDRDLTLRWLLLDRRTTPGSRLVALATAVVRHDDGMERATSVSGFPYGALGSTGRRDQ